MIPRANINAWRKVAPWPESAQVEQDLILSRALVDGPRWQRTQHFEVEQLYTNSSYIRLDDILRISTSCNGKPVPSEN